MFYITIAIILAIAAMIDCKHYTVPVFVQVLLLALASWNPSWHWQSALLGALVCGGVLLLPTFIKPENSFGGGDIKLVAILGYVLCYDIAIAGLFLAVSISLLPCLYYKLTQQKNTIAFVPYLAIGYSIAMVLFTI